MSMKSTGVTRVFGSERWRKRHTFSIHLLYLKLRLPFISLIKQVKFIIFHLKIVIYFASGELFLGVGEQKIESLFVPGLAKHFDNQDSG